MHDILRQWVLAICARIVARREQTGSVLPARSSSVIIVFTLKVYRTQTLLNCYNAVSTACLLRDGLDTFAATMQGLTPLHHASILDHADAAAALLSQDADVNAKDTKVRQIPNVVSVSLTCLAHALLVYLVYVVYQCY